MAGVACALAIPLTKTRANLSPGALRGPCDHTISFKSRAPRCAGVSTAASPSPVRGGISLARHRRGSQRRGPAPHHICANVWLWRCGTNGTAAPATAGLRPTPSSAPHYSRTAPPHPQSAPPWHCRNANGGAAATSVLERRHAWLLWGYNWLSEATQQAGEAVFVVCSLRILIRFRFGH